MADDTHPEKVYLACAGWDYEGFTVLGVYTTSEVAKQALDNSKKGYDYFAIQVFALNGERLEDDPEEYFFDFT